MRKTVFIKNAAVMTGCSVVLRLLGLVFKIWVAARVGSEGMGLYSLVISVYFFFAAFSTTGICTAVTRLCANNLSLGKDFRPVLKKCGLLTVLAGGFLSLIMFFFSSALSRLAVGDGSVSLCFKVLSLCLPALGISSLLRGCFFAVRRAKSSAFSQIAEQLVRIVLSYFLVLRFVKYGAAAACLALVIGDSAAELFCATLLYFQYKITVKKRFKALTPCDCDYRTVLRIAFPLTAGKYLSLFLRTAENLLIPRMLSKNGMGLKNGLSVFGTIRAMALPVLLFPAGFLSAVSTLLVPEISSSLTQKRYLIVKDLTEKTVKLTVVVSVIFACLFANLGREIGNILYSGTDTGILLTLLAPIVPLMYLDAVSDGILKGLDCQKFTFFTGVADSGMRVVLIVLLLPRFGITAFVFIMYLSNFFTSALNTFMLLKKSRGKIDAINTVFIPLCSALVITKATTLLLKPVAAYNSVLYIIASVAVSFTLYFACLVLLGSIKTEELRDIFA